MESWRRYLLTCITIFTTVLAVSVIIGWIISNPILIAPLPYVSPRGFNAAILDLFCSISLICLIFDYRKTSLLFTIPLLVLSALFALESFFSLDLGMKQLTTFELQFSIKTSLQPAPNTSLSFFLLALAQLCLLAKSSYSRLIWLAGLLSTIAFAISTASFYGYVGGFVSAQPYDPTQMTLYSTVTLILLSFATIALSQLYISVYPNQSKYFSSTLVFIIAASIVFSIYNASQRKATDNLLDLLNIQAKNLSTLIHTKLQDSYEANIRFRNRLEMSDALNNHLIETDAKSFLREIDGLEAILFVDEKGKLQPLGGPLQPLIDNGKLERLGNYSSKPIFFIEELLSGIDKLIFEAPMHFKDNQQSHIFFIYDPRAFLEIDLITPTKVEIILDDHLVYTNHYSINQATLSTADSSKFQDLEIKLNVSVDDQLINNIIGPVPKIGLVIGMLFAAFSGWIIYLLQQFRILLKELNISHNTKTMFLANIGHEIRTPLHGILGTGSLLEITKLEPKQTRYLNIVMLSARHLLDIVNNILDMTTLESNSFPVFSEPCDIRELCENQIKILNGKAAEKNLELKLKYEQEKPHLVNVATRPLKQIIMNLMGNAIKFTNDGNVVLDVLIKDKKNNFGEIQLNVIDKGIGIPDDKKHLIFQKFSQVDGQLSIQKGGTGLGLFLSKALVEKMGGKIWFESTLGKGSTFYVALPITFVTEEKTNE